MEGNICQLVQTQKQNNLSWANMATEVWVTPVFSRGKANQDSR